ncbi:MAG: CD225/dispanin family protein [Planctomycetes bacterium]|nr:CD225/dispanin family protein [Planctomycetota bacterium]
MIVVRILRSRPKVEAKSAGPVFCRRCGTESDGFRDLCVGCGEVLEEIVETKWTGERPPNYLAYAILSTIFCCMPFGIVSIVYAAQVNSYWETGQFERAAELSRKAKIWCWVAFICGIVMNSFWFLFSMFSFAGPAIFFRF